MRAELPRRRLGLGQLPQPGIGEIGVVGLDDDDHGTSRRVGRRAEGKEMAAGTLDLERPIQPGNLDDTLEAEQPWPQVRRKIIQPSY